MTRGIVASSWVLVVLFLVSDVNETFLCCVGAVTRNRFQPVHPAAFRADVKM